MTAAQVPEPTAEQHAIARQIVVGLRTLNGEPLRADSFDIAAEVARAIATAVASERAKYEAVRALHILDHDGGIEREHWVCQECDRGWPCETVRLINGAQA